MINFKAITIISALLVHLRYVNALALIVTLKHFSDHDGADSSGGISSEDYHTGQ